MIVIALGASAKDAPGEDGCAFVARLGNGRFAEFASPEADRPRSETLARALLSALTWIRQRDPEMAAIISPTEEVAACAEGRSLSHNLAQKDRILWQTIFEKLAQIQAPLMIVHASTLPAEAELLARAESLAEAAGVTGHILPVREVGRNEAFPLSQKEIREATLKDAVNIVLETKLPPHMFPAGDDLGAMQLAISRFKREVVIALKAALVKSR